MNANRKTEFEERISREDFIGAIRRIREQKTHASEYSGAAGQITRNEIELKGLNRKALALHLQLGKLDQPARVEVLRSLLQYEDYAGTFDQVDAFVTERPYFAAALAAIAGVAFGFVMGLGRPKVIVIRPAHTPHH